MRARRFAWAALTFLLGLPAADAQPVSGPVTEATSANGPWVVLGGAATAVRRGCQSCNDESATRHTWSLVADVGYAVDRRTAVGAEVTWVPVRPDAGRRSTTHVDALVQYRPWPSRGFLVKGGAGMAFVRYALEPLEASPVTSKALSLVLGAGWSWRREQRVGIELFASQHAAALGDLQTAAGPVNDVLTNFWSSGVAIVLR